jgi:YVTN family beta-propeller protein
MGKARSGHVLATVMFTDIVDSSRLAHELGDARWRVVLGRHHTIVRKALKRYHGREIDNAGDGFFASFPDQVDAIRCACAISEDVRELGIEIRAGCHVGQAEVVGRKLGGVTIHAGARVMSEAAPGEVLVSGVVRDLIPASGIEFADRGVHELKGIDGEWHLYAVAEVDGKSRPTPLEPAEAERRRAEVKPPKLVERRWGRVAIASAVAFVAVAAGLFIANRPHPIPVGPNDLVRIDPATSQILAAVPVAQPYGAIVVVPPREIWVLSELNQLITVVDAEANKATATVGAAGGTSTSGTAGGGVFAFRRMWVTNSSDQVETIDPTTHVLGGSLTIRGGPGILVALHGYVWAMLHDAQRAVAIDPNTMKIVLSAPIGSGGNGMAAGEGAVWVSNCGDATISKIDPVSAKATQIDVGVNPITSCPSGIGIGFGSVWVTDPWSGAVYRIDPATNKVIKTIKIGRADSGSYESDIAAFDGSMWVVSSANRSVVRVDPVTNTVQETIHLPYPPNAITVGLGSVWVTTTQDVE